MYIMSLNICTEPSRASERASCFKHYMATRCFTYMYVYLLSCFLWSSTLSSICIRAGVLKFDWLAYLTIGPEVGVSNLCQDRKLSQDFFLIWNYAAPRELSGAD